MSSLHRWFSSVQTWKRPLAISVAVTLLYSTAVFVYSVLPVSNASISGTLWHTLVLSTAFGLGTIGIPVFLWLQYDIRSPGVLLVGILAFWHVLAYLPPIGSGHGDSPGFLFVFVFAPLYLVAYGLLATIEYWLRGRTRLAVFSTP